MNSIVGKPLYVHIISSQKVFLDGGQIPLFWYFLKPTASHTWNFKFHQILIDRETDYPHPLSSTSWRKILLFLTSIFELQTEGTFSYLEFSLGLFAPTENITIFYPEKTMNYFIFRGHIEKLGIMHVFCIWPVRGLVDHQTSIVLLLMRSDKDYYIWLDSLGHA